MDRQTHFGFGNSVLVLAVGHTYVSVDLGCDVSNLHQGCATLSQSVRLLLLTFGPRASPSSCSRGMAGDDDGTDLEVALEALMLDLELEVAALI